MKLRSYADPGHGWLAVPIAAYLKSGIVASRYSYVNRTRSTVYLEEDCDAGLFLDAMKAQGIEVLMKHNHTNRQSKIRNMDSIDSIHTKTQIALRAAKESGLHVVVLSSVKESDLAGIPN